MQKFLIVLLVLGAGALALYFFNGKINQLPENLQDNTDIDYESVKEVLKEDNKRTVYGSCDAIATASNCIDYVGSIWAENNMAELNCEGAGVFSKNTCPYSEFGGCQTSAGTIMEIIAWTYREGPGGYNEESLPYAKKACDANPVANWTMPNDVDF